MLTDAEMDEYLNLQVAFEHNGGRGVEEAERIDFLRRKLHAPSEPGPTQGLACPHCGGRIQATGKFDLTLPGEIPSNDDDFDPVAWVQQQIRNEGCLPHAYDVYCENDCPEFHYEAIEGSITLFKLATVPDVD